MPPSASTSRTKCPLAMPPTAGLHDICAIRSTLSVYSAVFRPMRAQATAASHPACPAPTTTMSNCSVNCIDLSFYRFMSAEKAFVAFPCETLCPLWLAFEPSPRRAQSFTEEEHRGLLSWGSVGERRFLPTGGGKVPIACPCFVVVGATVIADGGITPVIHANL